MNNYLRVFSLTVALFAWSGLAHAVDITFTIGASIPPDDSLSHQVLRVDLAGDAVLSVEEIIPAQSPLGNYDIVGHHHVFSVPDTQAPGEYRVDFWMRSVDQAGNESAETPVVSTMITVVEPDVTPPDPPTGVTIVCDPTCEVVLPVSP